MDEYGRPLPPTSAVHVSLRSVRDRLSELDQRLASQHVLLPDASAALHGQLEKIKQHLAAAGRTVDGIQENYSPQARKELANREGLGRLAVLQQDILHETTSYLEHRDLFRLALVSHAANEIALDALLRYVRLDNPLRGPSVTTLFLLLHRLGRLRIKHLVLAASFDLLSDRRGGLLKAVPWLPSVAPTLRRLDVGDPLIPMNLERLKSLSFKVDLTLRVGGGETAEGSLCEMDRKMTWVRESNLRSLETVNLRMWAWEPSDEREPASAMAPVPPFDLSCLLRSSRLRHLAVELGGISTWDDNVQPAPLLLAFGADTLPVNLEAFGLRTELYSYRPKDHPLALSMVDLSHLLGRSMTRLWLDIEWPDVSQILAVLSPLPALKNVAIASTRWDVLARLVVKEDQLDSLVVLDTVGHERVATAMADLPCKPRALTIKFASGAQVPLLPPHATVGDYLGPVVQAIPKLTHLKLVNLPPLYLLDIVDALLPLDSSLATLHIKASLSPFQGAPELAPDALAHTIDDAFDRLRDLMEFIPAGERWHAVWSELGEQDIRWPSWVKVYERESCINDELPRWKELFGAWELVSRMWS